MNQKSADKKFENLPLVDEKNKFLGLDAFPYRILECIFSAHHTSEIEDVHHRLFLNQISIDDHIMEKFPPHKRHKSNLEDFKACEEYKKKSLVNYNALIVTKYFLNISKSNDKIMQQHFSEMEINNPELKELNLRAREKYVNDKNHD